MQKIAKLCLIVGCLLIAGSLALFLSVRIGTEQAQKHNAQVVQTILGLLPPTQPGVSESFSNMSMPALEIDGEDYIGLVEIPALGLMLPVSDPWDKGTAMKHPCRFDGTVYDHSLIIGGADRTGQFAGFDQLQLGYTVTVTDMTGRGFDYVIQRVDRTSTPSETVLTARNADLTLFVRDAYSMDYILLRCVAGKEE